MKRLSLFALTLFASLASASAGAMQSVDRLGDKLYVAISGMLDSGTVVAANTLSGLIPSLFQSLDVISRELVGAIPCATLDASVSRAAVGQLVTSFQTPAMTATNITPGVTPPNDGDANIDNISLTITKSRRVSFRWNGEEELGLNNNGAGASAIKNAQMIQAMRTLVNEIEVDCVLAARQAASRAYGTAGSTPFATSLGDPAQMRKILDDNGAPPPDRCLLIDTTAGANLRTLAQLTKANESGTTLTLRDGELLNLHGMSIHESAGVTTQAVGTGAAYATTTAGYAVGATAITVTTGAGTVLVGDYVTFAGDTNKYMVAVGIAGPGVVTLAAPGLRKAIPAAATALSVGAAATGNIAFSSSSLILATRAPALPQGGDLAVDRMLITDPRSGISFEVAMYPQYRQMQYEISCCWGVKGIKAAHGAVLLG